MEELVATYISGTSDCKSGPAKIASDIQNGDQTILNLIEKLGPHLTNNETEARIKSCSLLGLVLQNLSDDCLSEKEIKSLVTFLCCRLQDHYTLQPPTLICFIRISSSVNLSQEDAKILVDSIFKEVHVQSCLQSERNKVYQILTNILDNHMKYFVSIGRDFLFNMIQAIDGEQDPRNLLVVFQIVSDYVRSGANLFNLAEELFEVTSCYFPIDFNPAAVGKKAPITNEDLVLSLRRVMSSTSLFAPHCIPLMLEKMESDIESAKVDSILTLTDCLSKYGKSNLEPFLGTIWTTLKQEIIHANSPEVEKHGLELLMQITKNLSQWPVDNKTNKITDLKSFLNEVLEECLTRLKEPIQDKLTWMSGKMLLSCAKASIPSCNMIVARTMPLLLEQMNVAMGKPVEDKPVMSMQTNIQSITDNLVKIMTICSSFSYQEHPLDQHKASILKILISILTQNTGVHAKCTAIASVASLLCLNILTREQLEEVARCLLSLMNDELDNKLRHEVLSAAGYLSSKYSEIAKLYMMPVLFKSLPDHDFLSIPLSEVKKSLESVASLTTHFDVLQDVVSFLIELILKCKIDQDHCAFLEECLNCFQVITNNGVGHNFVEHLLLNVALPLIKICIEASLELSTPEQCCASCSMDDGFSLDCISLPIIKSVAVIVRNICQKQHPGKTIDFVVRMLTDLYLNGNINVFDIVTTKPINFVPFNPHFSLLQSRTVCFLTATISAFDDSVPIPQIHQFLSNLMQLCLRSTDPPTFAAAAKTFAGLVNKFHKSSDEILDKVYQHQIDNESSVANPKSTKLCVLTLLIWTTKALALCNHKKTKNFIRKLLGLLGDEDVGEVAAAGFDIIMRDSNEVLCPASHAVVRLMYRQRFFLLALPELVSGFHATSTDDGTSLDDSKRRKANHLTALSHMLLHLPKQALLQHFPELMPLLIQSMRSNDAMLLQSVLSALYTLTQDASELIEVHIDSLLEDFLRLSRFELDMDVRVKAVQCIGASTLLPTHVLLPLKRNVITKLALILDDRKRGVRREASKARSEWFLVGE